MILTPQAAVIASVIATVLFCMVVQRPLFMLYNRRSSTRPLGLSDFLSACTHGAYTDLIAACCLTAVPWIILALYNNFNLPARQLLEIYTAVASAAVGAIVVADTALYDFWHFKLDSSVLVFLKSPKGAFASVSSRYLAGGIAAIVVVAALYFIWMSWVYSLIDLGPVERGWATYSFGNLLMLALLALMGVAVRGVGMRPNNPTIALYSSVPLLNHAAQNSIYTFIYSLDRKNPYATAFRYYPQQQAEADLAALYPRQSAPPAKILTTDRPNIVVIVWESLSQRFFDDPTITPNLNRLAAEGVLFTNMDCGSYLTDRGLISIFSGLPGQPNATVGKYPGKLANLPALPRRLKEAGYATTVIHGGDLTVRQKADYYLASGHDTLIAESAFSAADPRCKWGVHDEVTFRRLAEEIARAPQPWMMTLQTLSSHEPFDVPSADGATDRMAAAFAYTDRALGEFVETLRKSPVWDNTLVVVVADHGVHYGSEYGLPLNHYEFPRIPAVMFGGAVKGPMRVDTITSQTDLAATILSQMGLPHDDFIFSRDVLSADYPSRQFSFHSYHNGVAVRTPEGWLDFDTIAERVAWGPDQSREQMARTILQCLYTYIDSL